MRGVNLYAWKDCLFEIIKKTFEISNSPSYKRAVKFLGVFLQIIFNRSNIIQTAGSKQRQAIEVDDEGQVSGQTTPSQDSDAPWIKKNGLYKLGYKQHTRTDKEGYIEKLHITPANTHECNHLSPLLEGIAEGTTVYAD